MTTLQRDWLRRIPGWAWTEQPKPRRRLRRDEGGRPMGRAEDDAQPPPEALGLAIPDEVEQRRREEEQKRRRAGLNLGEAPQAFGLDGHYLRNLATRFA